MNKTLLAANLALAALLVVAYVVIERAEPIADRQATPVVRPAALPFELAVVGGAEGQVVKLEDYAGRPVILNFWASWCDACKEERDELVELREKTGADFLGIATSDDLLDVKMSEDTRPHPYRVAWDATDAVANAYEVTGLPTTVVIGADGRVLRRVSRSLRQTDVAELASLLGMSREAKR